MKIGVIFDMDGTLVDSYQANFESWQQIAEKDGVVITEELFRKTFGQVNRDVIAASWPGTLDDDKVEEININKEIIFRDLLRKNFPPMSGALDLIKTLHTEGFKLAIGSSGPKENVALSSEQLGINPYLGGAVSGSDVKHGKPNPEVFLTAAAKIDVPPEQCVVVEDVRFGIEAAHAAGMKCIAILSTGHTVEEIQSADKIIHALSEITPSLIRELVNQGD